jgi:Tol biopolymer transport system component
MRHSTRWSLARSSALFMIPLASGCGGDTPAAPDTVGNSGLTVVLERTGSGSDADGVTVVLTHTASGTRREESAALGDTLSWDALPAGAFTIELADLAEQCEADGESLQVTLGAAGVGEAIVGVDCAGQFAYRRWFDHTRSDVHYLDEHGVDHRLFHGGFDIARSWSPDGQHLLVERWIDDRCETYRAGLDGSTQRVLEGETSVANASWSPGGDRIAVQYGPCSGGPDVIEIVLLDAETLAPLATIPNAGLDQHPAWSPDGSELAFVRNPDSLFVYTPATGDLELLALLPRQGAFPHWSPDDAHIALVLFFPQQVALVERGTGHQDIVTGDSIIAVGGAMAWFPDARTIGFVGLDGPDGGDEVVFTVDINDRTTRRFTHQIASASQLDVSGSSEVLLVSRPQGRNELFLTDLEGSRVRRILSVDQDIVGPMWRAGAGHGGMNASWRAMRTHLGVDGMVELQDLAARPAVPDDRPVR